ncbi:metalloregulator ArsR/SmtB family transcription factor [Duganella sp. FT80W]|uniref:Metalloregulator ArsR/SmtB family transcription factor n=1 Tax=Duganella guangzhouensis TaxID=2666084 RepID=A0A6I2KT15_9BURK|nr:winged helix-turn-helix domain-containing protein [Duganella guangzhouensis]MRW89045.1 metalloregulator ArsR/SmtB family transcription factor [Duganella guangzhouensis]
MNSPAQPRFARVAAAIGDPTRALMLSRLLDGRFYTATELAQHAGVSAPTASQHLKLLLDEGLVRVRAQGRHRYYMLADGNVAHALEALLRVADGALPESTRWQAPAMRGLRHARSCYGHLAGVLGVDLCRCFMDNGWVEGDAQAYALTAEGQQRVGALGINVSAAYAANAVDAEPRQTRQLYACVDWSERRDHFAGPLAVALLDNFIERGWLRRSADTRELQLTSIGGSELPAWLART